MEFSIETKDEILNIIKRASVSSANLTNREIAMLYHWINHINDPEYAWVPEEYKVDMPQYTGGRK